MGGPQLFPIYGRFVGDFVPHLVSVLTSDTMPELAEKVAVHSVGRRLPARDRGSADPSLRGRLRPADRSPTDMVLPFPVPP